MCLKWSIAQSIQYRCFFNTSECTCLKNISCKLWTQLTSSICVLAELLYSEFMHLKTVFISLCSCTQRTIQDSEWSVGRPLAGNKRAHTPTRRAFQEAKLQGFCMYLFWFNSPARIFWTHWSTFWGMLHNMWIANGLLVEN